MATARTVLHGLISFLVLLSADEVEDEDDDDQDGESGADGDRHHVVRRLVRLAMDH